MGTFRYLFLIVLASHFSVTGAPAQSWTGHFQKIFRHPEPTKRLITISSSKEPWHVPHFRQLICSWNAHRPRRGHLRFFARVRNKATSQWLSWHKIAEWGSHTQKSFSNAAKGSSHHFVRLELDQDLLADAFEIKVHASHGAHLKDMAMVSVTVARPESMAPESATHFKKLPSVLIHCPAISQFLVDHPDAHRICSPVSSTMLVSYLTGKRINPISFAEKSYDHGLKVYGNWAFNAAHAFEQVQGSHYIAVARLGSWSDLHALLQKKIPIVVSIRGELAGAPKPYPEGHLLLVIGYNNRTQEVICHDPAQPEAALVKTAYALEPFLRAWERSHRLAYIARPAKREEQACK